MSARVTEARTHSHGGEYEVEITVVRLPYADTLSSPVLTDVPDDIREALTAWLGGAS